MYSDRENVNILTAVLIGHGIRHMVVCPGSRNSPLVHNFHECPDIVCHPATDERSAGFLALGITIQTGRPAGVCITSGSALLNILPAAAEATYQHQGIIVISADRPGAWIGQLDGQTMPQKDVTGCFTGISVSIPEPHDDTEIWECNRLANEALMTVNSPARPSVHINVPISEPLFSYSVETLPEERIIHNIDWSPDWFKESICRKITEASRPMIVLGQLPEYAIPDDHLQALSGKITILTEPLSAGRHTWTPADAMLSAIEAHPEEYLPDVVIYMGGNTVSKRLRRFLRAADAYQMTVSADGTLHDVSCTTRLVITGDPGDIISDLNGMMKEPESEERRSFLKLWNSLKNSTEQKISSYRPPFSQMLAVKILEEMSDDRDTFFYANSSAVRLAALLSHHHCHCNRGLNGIEGSLSTAMGAAMAKAASGDKSPVFCIIGDLSFFYDQNALWQNEIPDNLRILLLNNSGGGIFRSLDGLWKSPAAEDLIAGRHNVTAEGICMQNGMEYMKAQDENTLTRGICALRQRPMLLEVTTDPEIDKKTIDTLYGHE